MAQSGHSCLALREGSSRLHELASRCPALSMLQPKSGSFHPHRALNSVGRVNLVALQALCWSPGKLPCLRAVISPGIAALASLPLGRRPSTSWGSSWASSAHTSLLCPSQSLGSPPKSARYSLPTWLGVQFYPYSLLGWFCGQWCSRLGTSRAIWTSFSFSGVCVSLRRRGSPHWIWKHRWCLASCASRRCWALIQLGRSPQTAQNSHLQNWTNFHFPRTLSSCRYALTTISSNFPELVTWKKTSISGRSSIQSSISAFSVSCHYHCWINSGLLTI